jgi:hypothetical protein
MFPGEARSASSGVRSYGNSTDYSNGRRNTANRELLPLATVSEFLPCGPQWC